jgi:hypothetical protein
MPRRLCASVGAQPLLRLTEVQNVAGVVSEGQQHAFALVGGLGDRVHLLGRRGSEQVSHRGAVRESLPDQTAERGVVARTAAHDDGHRGARRDRGTHDASGNRNHPARVGGHEAFDELVGEIGRIVEQPGHARWAVAVGAMAENGTPGMRCAAVKVSTVTPD